MSRPQVASQLQVKIQSTLRASLRISKTCKNFILLPLVQPHFEGNSMTVSQGNHFVVRRMTCPSEVLQRKQSRTSRVVVVRYSTAPAEVEHARVRAIDKDATAKEPRAKRVDEVRGIIIPCRITR